MTDIKLRGGYSVITDPVSNRKIIVAGEYDDSVLTDDEVVAILGNVISSNTLSAIRNRASVDELLEFANEVRKFGGSNNMLTELIPSIPGDTSGCLIANALNFESEVDGDGDGGWTMTIDDSNIVCDIGNGLGLSYFAEVEECYDGYDPGGYVCLPYEIGLCAEAFDSYADYELECFNSNSATVKLEES